MISKRVPIFALEGRKSFVLPALSGQGADQELSHLAKALAHPARLQILRSLIKKSGCFCGEIVENLPLAQSTVSQHLKVLKDSGLIQGNIKGPATCYCVDLQALKKLKVLVAAL